MMDDLLKKYGLKYEDLNSLEKETLNNWLAALHKDQLTIEKVREYILTMRDSLILEISDYQTNTKQDLLVKARIRNYTLILAFLTAPDKAKQQLEKAIAGLSG